MSIARYIWLGLLASIAAIMAASMPAAAQQQQKPNILFIMGDDIGIMQPSMRAGLYQTKNGLLVRRGSLRSRKSTTLAEISSSTVFERVAAGSCRCAADACR